MGTSKDSLSAGCNRRQRRAIDTGEMGVTRLHSISDHCLKHQVDCEHALDDGLDRASFDGCVLRKRPL
jgi:hypothetical protein